MKKRLVMAVVSLFAVASLSVPVLAADQNAPATTQKGAPAPAGLSAAEKEFMTKAAASGMMEVQLGKLAQQKASSQAVKDFGKRMETDHQKANDELKNLAQKGNVQLPGQMERKQQMLVDKLGQFSGAQFDKKYMAVMVQDHKEDIGKFMRISKKAKDPELKQWVDKTIPVLEQHLQLAKQTAQQVGVQVKSGAQKPAAKPETQKK